MGKLFQKLTSHKKVPERENIYLSLIFMGCTIASSSSTVNIEQYSFSFPVSIIPSRYVLLVRRFLISGKSLKWIAAQPLFLFSWCHLITSFSWLTFSIIWSLRLKIWFCLLEQFVISKVYPFSSKSLIYNCFWSSVLTQII